MATGDFDQHYSQNPWANIEQNKRPWYVPELYKVWRQATVYNKFITTQFNMNGPKADTMYFDTLLLPNANNNPIGLRDIWANASHMDSKRRKITFTRYGTKMSLNRYEDLVNFWLMDGRAGLARIISGENGLGYQMVEVLEKLARNAFLSNPPRSHYGTGSGTKFNTITSSDKVSTDLIENIIQGMKERGLPMMQTGDGTPGRLVCVTTPGVIADLRKESLNAGVSSAWLDVHRYQGQTSIINGEIGIYHGVRFVESNRACLYNAGRITVQTAIKSPASAGDGSPDPANSPVDQIEYVGQPSATHFITVADTTGFAANQIVTIHVARTSANGVSNGVDFTDGKTLTRRIIEVVDGTTLTLDEPLTEDFTVDLGGTVYGYVTLGRNVHSAMFTAFSNGVVQGVHTPPTLHTPPPVDDFDMIYRFSWDAYMGYTIFEKEAFYSAFMAGTNVDYRNQAY